MSTVTGWRKRTISKGTSMTKELKRFEQWWDAEDDIPNDGPYTPDTPIQFAWAGWQAALAQPEQAPYIAISNDRINVDPYTGNVSIGTVAQPEQEPVAYTNGTDVILAKYWTADYPPKGWEPLGYTTPPQRKPLTNEENT